MTSGVTFHHHPWEAHTVGRRHQVMPSLLLESIHSRTKSSVASYYRPCIEHTIKCCWAWHACIALRQPTRSDNVGRGMPTWPLGSINGWMTPGVTCHHRPWAAHTVRFFLAWNARMVLRKHAQLDDIDHCMPSSPLGSTLFRMTSGVTFHHHPWEAHTVGRVIKVCHN